MQISGNSKLWSYFDSDPKIKKACNSQIRKGEGHPVSSFIDLATKLAEFQFRNPEYVCLFRGQNNDFRSRANNSTLKPTLFRPKKGEYTSPKAPEIIRRYQILEKAEHKLVELYHTNGWLGHKRLARHRILRWSILQHYEICPTPLLDVTQSLRIATSFASIKALPDKAFLYVLGVPNLSGGITVSAESGLQIIRLSSVCPPVALRPHIQEGYLLGEFPEMGHIDQVAHIDNHEIDFGRRVVAKFRFDPKTFRTAANFQAISTKALYPNESDSFYECVRQIKKSIKSDTVN